jgi:hypothetical protein
MVALESEAMPNVDQAAIIGQDPFVYPNLAPARSISVPADVDRQRQQREATSGEIPGHAA